MRKLVIALLPLCACVLADTQSAVAIRNARIVTVSGPVIAKGTVILRKGLIEAVGDNVPVPADAWVVEGEGLTVYPGMIDALSTVGMPSLPATGTAAGRGGGGRGQTSPTPAGAPTAVQALAAPSTPPTPSRGPQDRPSTTSWLIAADEVSPADRRIELVRGAGITTTATYPVRGIFAGQGSLLNLLSGEKTTAMVLVPSVGQYITLPAGRGGGGGGGFPASLMGVISYIRQIYLDAGYYQLVKDTYAKEPRGMQRPEYDRALEGVLESKRILLPANRLVEIDRMLRFATELKQPTILYGGRESYRPEAATLLKKAGAPILLSLRWPEKGRDVNPEDIDSFRVLETRDKAPSAPAVLKGAGVKFALYSDGIDQGRDLNRAVKKAIDAGLSREDAVRAMTLSPAEIYGVADRLGSIEKGKIANIIVTRGELFEPNTKIEMIFVDGKKYTTTIELPSGGGGRGPVTDDPGVNR